MHHALNPNLDMMASGCDEAKEVGDICLLGENAGNELRIVHIDEGEAWVRSIQGVPCSWLVKLTRLRLVRKGGKEKE